MATFFNEGRLYRLLFKKDGNAPDEIKMDSNHPIDGEAGAASRGGEGAGRRVAMRRGRKTGRGTTRAREMKGKG